MGSPPRRRIYLVGCGAIAGLHLAHARRHAWGLDLLWHATDHDEHVRDRFSRAHPDVNVHASLETMLDTPPMAGDIVIVCTPPDSHHAVTLAALASGRHVLCEKPLAPTRVAAEEMLAAASSTGRLLGCCSTRFLGSPVVDRARAWVARTGTDPLRVRWIERHHRERSGIEYQPGSFWFLDRSRSGGGVTMDWGPYDLAVLDHLFAPEAITVRACSMSRVATAVDPPDTVFDVETDVTATLHYTLPDGRGVPVSLDRASATHGTSQRLFEIEGSREALTFEWIRTPALAVHGDRGGNLVTAEHDVPPSPMDVHARPLHEMLRAVEGEFSLALLNERAVFNQAVLCALYEVADGGEPVTLRRSEMR